MADNSINWNNTKLEENQEQVVRRVPALQKIDSSNVKYEYRVCLYGNDYVPCDLLTEIVEDEETRAKKYIHAFDNKKIANRNQIESLLSSQPQQT